MNAKISKMLYIYDIFTVRQAVYLKYTIKYPKESFFFFAVAAEHTVCKKRGKVLIDWKCICIKKDYNESKRSLKLSFPLPHVDRWAVVGWDAHCRKEIKPSGEWGHGGLRERFWCFYCDLLTEDAWPLHKEEQRQASSSSATDHTSVKFLEKLSCLQAPLTKLNLGVINPFAINKLRIFLSTKRKSHQQNSKKY